MVQRPALECGSLLVVVLRDDHFRAGSTVVACRRMSASPPAIVATAYFHHRRPDPFPDVAACTAHLFRPAQPQQQIIAAFQNIDAPVMQYVHGSVNHIEGGGFARLLRVDGQEVQLICCKTTSAGTPKTLMEECARRALEVVPCLGKGWRWEVLLTDVQGNRFPVR